MNFTALKWIIFAAFYFNNFKKQFASFSGNNCIIILRAYAHLIQGKFLLITLFDIFLRQSFKDLRMSLVDRFLFLLFS